MQFLHGKLKELEISPITWAIGTKPKKYGTIVLKFSCMGQLNIIFTIIHTTMLHKKCLWTKPPTFGKDFLMMEPLNKAPSEGEREGMKKEEDPSGREKSKTQSGSLGGK
jgi:hypothetical protein